jgi:DNA-directed RNA polymerase specialized sigma24 family protein
MDEENIDDLIEAIRQNKPKADKAFKILLDRFRGLMFGLYSGRYYRHLTSSDFDTLYHSAVADAILTFNKEKGAFGLWLGCNLVYNCRAESRNRFTLHRQDAEEEMFEVVSQAADDSPIERMIKDEMLARVRRALEKEREPSRSFLIAWANGSPPVEEVAAAFGKTPDNARQIRHRNMVNMRKDFVD